MAGSVKSMTYDEMIAIQNPVVGKLVFDTTNNILMQYTESGWVQHNG